MSVGRVSRVRTGLIIAALAITTAVEGQSDTSTLDAAKASTFLGDWTLTVKAGRGPVDLPLSIRDVYGKVEAEIGGGRGGPVTITDVTMPAGDLILRFKQTESGGEIAVTIALTLNGGGLTVKQTINGIETTGTGVKSNIGSAAAAGRGDARVPRGAPRSGPAEGGTAGTIDSVCPSSFVVLTPADVMVTVEMTPSTTFRKGTSTVSASAVNKGESVLVLGTVHLGTANQTTITASQVMVQPSVGSGSASTSAKVVPFRRGARSAEKKVGQIPGNYIQGEGAIVGAAEADQATVQALDAYRGGIVDRVVKLSTGEYEVHNIGVNWPHHIFVNLDFKVVGAE